MSGSVRKISFSRLDSATHCASVSSLLATFENCSNSGFAKRSMPGIDCTSSSAVSRPPVAVGDGAARGDQPDARHILRDGKRRRDHQGEQQNRLVNSHL